MNKKLFLFATASLLLIAPLQTPLFGLTGDDTIGPPKTTTVIHDSIKKDGQITLAVKGAFASDKNLANENISVTTENGVVTLGGTASNARTKASLEYRAKTVAGVKKVINNIQVKAEAKTTEK